MASIEWTSELRFLISLVLGFLVGLERESTKADHKWIVMGGVRTFPIVSMFGFGCAWVFQVGEPFLLPVGLLAVGGLAAIAYVAKIRAGRYGATSELSFLLTFVVGALCLIVDVWIPMALGLVNALLLSEKAELESYVERLDKNEFLAVLKFLLVTVIVLPVLPNEEYTRFGLNPTRIWQIVILVSSVGFLGYFLTKMLGQRAGLWLSGLLGGIVSSTAVTVGLGRMVQSQQRRQYLALQAALLASIVMYLRILVLVWIVNAVYVQGMWWKMIALSAIGGLLTIGLPKEESEKSDQPENVGLHNPFEIRPALLFAGLFVALLVVSHLVRVYVGTGGILGLGALVGFTDIDPFILSIVNSGEMAQHIVTAGILLAALSNTIAKGVYFGVLVPPLRRQVAWRYGLWAVLHVPFILL